MEKLTAELNTHTVFTIPLFGGIPVFESVVVTWGIMLFVLVISLLLTRNLKVKDPSKGQLLLEMCISKIYGFFTDTIGEGGEQYVPYLVSVLFYIGIANLTGVIGITPPTKDINVTVALAFMSICLIEAAGVRARGGKGYLKSLAEPIAIITPINIMEIGIRPLSLCMRLFGNVLGSFVIMELIKLAVPVGVPAICSLYFDFFDGLIQAFVFVFLTTLFMRDTMGN